MERSTGMDARSASRLARLAAPPPVDPAPAFSIPQFRRALLTWYRRTARRLPWRDTHDPYRVWVSEIMLQQTRVDTVVPYYEHFLAAFPTAQALAAAPLPRVLHLWQGLGYYRRARHLHRAALLLVRGHGGELPRTASAWSALPGVGRYTAAAIASIVHGEPVAAVDGNVKRVLARLCRITDDLDAPATQRRLWALADALLAPRAPGDFNQAMMELGARVCTPRTP
ncbi:MAG: A/G-specific adenine glycosylase, partial [Planctomycetota bacterium]